MARRMIDRPRPGLGARLAAILGALVPATTAGAQENVLLIIADDLGVDRVGAYNAHPSPGNTPVIDQLAAQGVLFRNAWAYATCSPSRATMLTGRYGFRTGVGTIIRETSNTDPGLGLGELTLPERIAPTYTSVVLGKWHLGNDWSQGATHPLDSGFDAHAGSRFNLRPGHGNPPSPGDNYFDWMKSVNGVEAPETTYATTDTVDDALRAIEALPEPWFIWLAFNAPHRPFHAPPPHLHTYNLNGPPEISPVPHMKAMTQAMDTEMGRLLASVDMSRTTVIFIGDNGTTGDAVTPPQRPDHAKGTLYEGGVNVPLIVVSPRVTRPGSECAGLVCATDIFATVSDVAGHGARSRDGISFLPYLADPSMPSIRSYLYAEIFVPNGPYPYNRIRRAIRGERYKLIDRRMDHEREFYDLLQDPFELNDLLTGSLTAEQAQALQELETGLVRLWNTRD